MLQNSRVTSFTVFELLRENQLEGARGGEGGGELSPTQIRINKSFSKTPFAVRNSYLLTVIDEKTEKTLTFSAIVIL